MAQMTAAALRASWLLGISGTTEDTYLGLVIARVEGAIARHLGFPAVAGAVPSLDSGSYTRYGPDADSGIRIDGPNLLLEPRPVSAVASIYDDTNEAWGADTLVAATDYAVFPWGVRLKPTSSHGEWSDSPYAIKATFTAGWAAASAPVDVMQAIGMTCKHWVMLRDRQGISGLPAQAGSMMLRDETLPDVVRELLAPLRLPSVYL